MTDDNGKGQAASETYPLFLRSIFEVSTMKFSATVRMTVPVLLAKEDKWYFYGVQPGTFCASGDSLKDAMDHGREEVSLTIGDLAASCNSFIEFKREIDALRNSRDEFDRQRWNEALIRLRGGAAVLPHEFDELKRLDTSSTNCELIVEEVKREAELIVSSSGGIIGGEELCLPPTKKAA